MISTQGKAVHLYDAETIDNLVWPSHEDGHETRKYLYPLVKNGPESYIDNVKTKMFALQVDDIVLPVTVNEAEYDNSYVCSIYSHYIGCLEELIQKKIPNLFLKKLVARLIQFKGKLLQWGKINQVVTVNNWLFPTNLYPEIDSDQIEAISAFLIQQFPHHAIVFKSLNAETTPSLFASLKKNCFDFIAKRRVFLLETTDKHVFKARMFKSDLKLLQDSSYKVLEHTDISQDAAGHLLSLYTSLYLDKHSKYSPKLNLNFMHLALKERILSFKALQKEGEIVGTVGYFSRDGLMTSPLFGYDVDSPQHEGVYRCLSTLITLEAKEQGMLLNQSAGAASFKTLRRAKPQMEYLAVYRRHLSLKRKIPWAILQKSINGIGIPIMEYFGL